MPAIEATGERFSSDRRPGMDRPFIVNSRDRASRLCVGNFIEHALRRRGDVAWINRPGRCDFLCGFSAMAAPGGHGVLFSRLLFDWAVVWGAVVRMSEKCLFWLVRDCEW